MRCNSCLCVFANLLKKTNGGNFLDITIFLKLALWKGGSWYDLQISMLPFST